MFRRFGNTLARFMYGRYGSDRFNRFLLVLYLILWVLSALFRGWTGLIFYALTTVTMVWTLFPSLPQPTKKLLLSSQSVWQAKCPPLWKQSSSRPL